MDRYRFRQKPGASRIMKNLVAFDFDGTLATSKQAIDPEMADLFSALLQILPVAVISGGDWPQFERQLLELQGNTAALRGSSRSGLHDRLCGSADVR